jgi:hypothetical protein
VHSKNLRNEEFEGRARTDFISGTVQSRSAIVPGLCEESQYKELPSLRRSPSRAPDKRRRK